MRAKRNNWNFGSWDNPVTAIGDVALSLWCVISGNKTASVIHIEKLYSQSIHKHNRHPTKASPHTVFIINIFYRARSPSCFLNLSLGSNPFDLSESFFWHGSSWLLWEAFFLSSLFFEPFPPHGDGGGGGGGGGLNVDLSGMIAL